MTDYITTEEDNDIDSPVVDRTPGRVDEPSVHVDGPRLYDMVNGEDEIEHARRHVY